MLSFFIGIGMVWADIEKAFNRAALFSLSKKKAGLVFPVLIFCGILIVFCRAAAYEASGWLSMSFIFLPILFSSGILLSLGVLLVRIHHHEAKQLKLGLKELLQASMDLILGISYLAIIPILVYLCLWILMGIFLLLQGIPGVGLFFSVVFAFGPFLLIFSSMLLCLFNIGLLFFIAPAAALQSLQAVSLAKKVFATIQKKLFSCIVLFLIGSLPLILAASFLCFAARVTGLNFLIGERSLSVALEWFFIMLPFCAILTPFVVFFFNFSAESYQLLERTSKLPSSSSLD